MRRYQGEALPSAPRVAVVGNDALGNYVVLTPLFQAIVREWAPSRLDYYGGRRTEELWSQETLLTRGFPLFGTPPRQAAEEMGGPYDLVVNVEDSPWARAYTAMLCDEDTFVVGPCLDREGRGELAYPDDPTGDLWRDPAWIDAAGRYPFLATGFIGEIFCRLAYLKGDVPPYRLPSVTPRRSLPNVLIATAASLPEKLWPRERWEACLRLLRAEGLRAGLLGAKPSAQRRYWQGDQDEDWMVAEGLVDDLRGEFTLPEVVGALAKVEGVVTLDNGILHLAAATQTPTVGIFRHGIHRLWCPPAANVTAMVPEEGRPVADVTAEAVAAALLEVG